MLNEEKIKLMTAIAMFEKKEGRHIFPSIQYFRSDYIGAKLLRSFFGFTFCYLLCIGVWGLCSMEKLLSIINTEDLIQMGVKFAVYYGAGLFVYLILTYCVYAKRYEYANRSMKVYVAKLRRLEKQYSIQNKPSGKGGQSV